MTTWASGVDTIRKRSFGRFVLVESFSIWWPDDVGWRNESTMHATAIAGNRFPNASVVVVPDTVVA